MFFASDNAGPVHPQVMEALANANTGYAGGYGNDALTAEVQAQIRTVFEAPRPWFILSRQGLLLMCWLLRHSPTLGTQSIVRATPTSRWMNAMRPNSTAVPS